MIIILLLNKKIRNYSETIILIYDLANRKHDWDILIEQNFFENIESRYDYLIDQNTLSYRTLANVLKIVVSGWTRLPKDLHATKCSCKI